MYKKCLMDKFLSQGNDSMDNTDVPGDTTDEGSSTSLVFRSSINKWVRPETCSTISETSDSDNIRKGTKKKYVCSFLTHLPEN